VEFGVTTICEVDAVLVNVEAVANTAVPDATSVVDASDVTDVVDVADVAI